MLDIKHLDTFINMLEDAENHSAPLLNQGINVRATILDFIKQAYKEGQQNGGLSTFSSKAHPWVDAEEWLKQSEDWIKKHG